MLLLSEAVLFGLGVLIAVIIPTAVSVVIENFYKNRTVNVLHAIFGIAGVLLFLNYLTADHVRSIISINWVNHKAKFIVISILMIGFFISTIYSSVSMVLVKSKEQKVFHYDDTDKLSEEDEEEATYRSSLTEKEMDEYLLKARAYMAAKNEIKIQRERSAANAANNSDSEKEN